MAGKLTISTLNDSSGVLATQNGMTGIAKAWVQFDGLTGSTATIKTSFNVSSITYNASGDYTINFTTAMSSANYAVSGCGSNGTQDAQIFWVANTQTVPTASLVRMKYASAANAVQGGTYLSATIFSS